MSYARREKMGGYCLLIRALSRLMSTLIYRGSDSKAGRSGLLPQLTLTGPLLFTKPWSQREGAGATPATCVSWYQRLLLPL